MRYREVEQGVFRPAGAVGFGVWVLRLPRRAALPASRATLLVVVEDASDTAASGTRSGNDCGADA